MAEPNYAGMAQQAREAAALRLQRGQMQPGTLTRTPSRYSDVGPFISALLPQTPLDVALYAAGPVGKLAGKAAAGAGVTLGTILSGVDEAQAGPAGTIKKLLPGMLKEITGEPGAPQRFYDALKAMKEASPHGAPAVDLKTVKQYSEPGARLFLGPENQSGFAMHGTELNSVFKHPQSPLAGAGAAITERALKEGADRLDAYATPQLMKQYGTQGFQEVARVPFEHVTGIDKPAMRAAFPELTGETPTFAEKKVGNIRVGGPGEPDLVGMVRNPPVPTRGLPTRDFEDMQVLQELAATGRPPNLFIPNVQRAFAPRIYDNPRLVAEEAAGMVRPEDQRLYQVFKLHRGDLLDIAKQRMQEPGTLPPPSALPTNPRGSQTAAEIMTPENRQRLLDFLYEGLKQPALPEGMIPWYVQEPLALRMQQAGGDYPLLNAFQGSASARSGVEPEISRGSAAYMLQQQGRFPEFADKTYAGTPGHMFHKTHAQAMQGILDRMAANPDLSVYDALTGGTIKQPAYIASSGVPGVGGFSWNVPAGDAHFATMLGLPDVRSLAIKESMGEQWRNPEAAQLLPWWQGIAQQAGLQATPGQSLLWGVGAPATGVRTMIGAPKLEMQAIAISDAAAKAGKSVDRFLADALKKKPTEHWMAPLLAAPLGAAALDQYAPEAP